jgi:acetyl esterase/lipase
MNTRQLSAILPGLLLCCMTAAAQVPPGMTMKPMATPVDSNAIALYPGAAPGSEGAQQKEQWSEVMGDHVARNVNRPTLTPYLPAKGTATGAAVIVAPGGGFMVLSMKNEGVDVARWLADRGVAAFLLKYRVNPTPANDAEMTAHMAKVMGAMATAPRGQPPPVFTMALDDAQQALRLVRSRAAEWQVDPKRVGMIGFSAGAMTTLQTALRNDPVARADFIATIYGSLSTVQVPANAPPLFVAIAADDPLLGGGDFGLIKAWREAKAPVELHYFERGGHGFGMRHQSTTSDLWAEQFYAWMKARGLFAAAPPVN